MQVNIDFKKLSALFNLNHAYSFLFGMLGAMIVCLIAYKTIQAPREIATVDITRIIRQFTHEEAKKNLSEDDLKKETKSFVIHLEKTLQIFAQKNNVVLLPKEAIIVGSHDYTQAILESVRDK